MYGRFIHILTPIAASLTCPLLVIFPGKIKEWFLTAYIYIIMIIFHLLYQYTCNRYWHYTLFSLSKIMQMLLNMYLEFNHLTQNIKFFLCDAVCVFSLIQCNHMILNMPLSGPMPTIVLVDIKFNVCIIMTTEKCNYMTLYFP